jgi:hypothetical protein
MNTRALVTATVLGTVLQLVMVVVGHSHPGVARLFAVGGMSFSFVAGLVYAVLARGGPTSSLTVGGLIAGAVCALIGIFVSYMLKDVPAAVLAFGTVSSGVTGAIGGLVGKFLVRGAAAAGVALLLAGSTTPGDAQPAPAEPRPPAAVPVQPPRLHRGRGREHERPAHQVDPGAAIDRAWDGDA